MLKVVVFDSGSGGEALADKLEREIPTLEVIRVIDWRHAEVFDSAHKARKLTEEALRPYIGTVDLIVLANYLLTFTSLKYFRHKYPKQKFMGLHLPNTNTNTKTITKNITSKNTATKITRTSTRINTINHHKPLLVLTTTSINHTIKFQKYMYKLHRPTTILRLDDWPELIDNGELTIDTVKQTIGEYYTICTRGAGSAGSNRGTGGARGTIPNEILILHAHFNAIIKTIRRACGWKIRVIDGMGDTIIDICRTLNLRGGRVRK